MQEEVNVSGPWMSILTMIVELFENTKFARCSDQDSKSGHDFVVSPPLSLANMDGVRLAAFCTYCGKTADHDIVGLMKPGMINNNTDRGAN